MRYLRWLPLVLLALYLLTGVRQIEPNERAVVRRFGRVLEKKPRPGLYIGLPWGMDRVERIQVDQVQSVTFGYLRDGDEVGNTTPSGQYLTGDRNLANIRVVLNYNADDDALEDYIEQLPVAQAILERVGEAVLAEWLAGRSIKEVLLPNDQVVQRELVGNITHHILPYRLGVKIQSLNIVQREVPIQVRDAFDDVNKATQEKITRSLEARQYKSQTETSARIESDRAREEAEVAYREQIIRAEVDRDSFLHHLRNVPKPGKERDAYFRLVWWQYVGEPLMTMRREGRIRDMDPYLMKNGVEIILPMPLPTRKNQ